MQRLHDHPGQVNNVHAVLEASGYRIRGQRADCPYCTGHARLTVALRGELFYCHRCARGGHIRQLARSMNIALPAPRVRLADIPKNQFRLWLAKKMSEMSRAEYALVKARKHALDYLEFFPSDQQDPQTCELAWAAIARYYHRERYFQTFWDYANDRIGRVSLYKTWRKHRAR
jgi:hypothetical protein